MQEEVAHTLGINRERWALVRGSLEALGVAAGYSVGYATGPRPRVWSALRLSQNSTSPTRQGSLLSPPGPSVSVPPGYTQQAEWEWGPQSQD